MSQGLESNYIKKWSNVVCVNRDESDTAELLEQLSIETESSA